VCVCVCVFVFVRVCVYRHTDTDTKQDSYVASHKHHAHIKHPSFIHDTYVHKAEDEPGFYGSVTYARGPRAVRLLHTPRMHEAHAYSAVGHMYLRTQRMHEAHALSDTCTCTHTQIHAHL
jgi:hypothetical protein